MLRRALVLPVLLAVTTAPVAADAQPAPAADATLRVVQHNTDHIPAAWEFVVDRIEADEPELVTVQEVCRPWVEALREEHPSWTFAYHPRKRHFGNSKNPGCHGDFIGELAIHTGAANRPTMVIDYPNNNPDGVEKFGMACVEFRREGIPVLGCSTHLSAYPTSGGRGTQPEREPQVQAIVDATAAYRDAGWSVVLGGDLNLGSANGNHAPALNLALGPAVGGTGDFYDGAQHEYDRRPTEPTTDKGNRIDYVLWSDNRTPFPGHAATEQINSPAGHHLLSSIGILSRTV